MTTRITERQRAVLFYIRNGFRIFARPRGHVSSMERAFSDLSARTGITYATWTSLERKGLIEEAPNTEPNLYADRVFVISEKGKAAIQ